MSDFSGKKNAYLRPAGSERGFSLFLVLLMFAAAATIVVATLSLTGSLRKIEEEKLTSDNLLLIRDGLKEYYASRQDLPSPDTDNKVPVTTLNVEAGYLYDKYGQLIHYNEVKSSGRTDILGVIVNGKCVAGVLVSGGPDQQIAVTTWPGGTSITYSSTTDDIVIPVNVFQEAQRIAWKELQNLQGKVVAYCLSPGPAYQSNEDLDNHTVNDLPYNISGFAVIYGLNDYDYEDPWLRNYVWGYNALALDVGAPVADGTPRYHRFFSAGPDGQTGNNDDIIAPGALPETPCDNPVACDVDETISSTGSVSENLDDYFGSNYDYYEQTDPSTLIGTYSLSGRRNRDFNYQPDAACTNDYTDVIVIRACPRGSGSCSDYVFCINVICGKGILCDSQPMYGGVNNPPAARGLALLLTPFLAALLAIAVYYWRRQRRSCR